MKDAIKHIEANNPRVRKIMDILGLPDESYQEVNPRATFFYWLSQVNGARR